MRETGCYLYAITQGISSEDVSTVSGLGGTPVRLVEHRELTAVVSDVNLEEFSADSLSLSSGNSNWLDEMARTHHAVVNEVATLAPTAPIRLATVCHGDGGVCSRLDEWYDALRRILGRIEGRMEWNVTASAPTVTYTDKLHLALSKQAVASRRLLRNGMSNGHRGAAALNGAYLVENDGMAEFHALARRLAERHPDARLAVRGPWPPYSFATLEST
jgi:hypothetical protein